MLPSTKQAYNSTDKILLRITLSLSKPEAKISDFFIQSKFYLPLGHGSASSQVIFSELKKMLVEYKGVYQSTTVFERLVIRNN